MRSISKEFTVLDLFSGIGGFSLGLHGPASHRPRSARPTPFACSVLARHWPGVPIYDDVRTLSAARLQPTGCRGRTSSAAASRVRTSASPAGARASRASVGACGPTWRAWCGSADRTGWWLRTFLGCASAARTESCLSWRLRATPAGRWWWVLPMPAPRIGEAASGWWRKPLLPTLVARDWKHGSVGQQKRARACQLNDAVGGRLHPGYAEWLMGFPAGWTVIDGHASRRWATRRCPQPLR